MKPPKSPPSFEATVDRYLTHQRALGKEMKTPGFVLRRLVLQLRERGVMNLNAESFECWQRSQSHLSPNSRRQNLMIVHRVCRYRCRTEPDTFVPDPLTFPRMKPAIKPVIVHPESIAKLLAIVDGLKARSAFPLRKEVFRFAVILLYTTGMRLGEVARLTLNDIDLREGVVRVRGTKFQKSRLVPLASSARQAAKRYLTHRLAPPWDVTESASLFGHHHGCEKFRGYATGALGHSIRKLFLLSRIRGDHGQTPRVHDLRHSFAVQALLRWYRNGLDVQAKLPHLSIFMGHASIASTAYYLHFIPEIAAIASRKFESHFYRKALRRVA
jgi:integrase/recombinase XerD